MPLIRVNWRITAELGTMGRYLSQISILLSNEKDQLEDDLQNAALQLPPEERDEFEASNWGEISEIAEDYPNILYTSFLLSWYSFVESSLFLACRDFNLQLTIDAEDRNNLGKGISRARTFIKQAGSHEIAQNLWRELTYIQKIRNSIVHDQGRIPTFAHTPPGYWSNPQMHELRSGVEIYVDLESNLYQYSVGHDIIKYRGPRYCFQPNLDFCKHLIEFAKLLFDDVYLGLRNSQP